MKHRDPATGGVPKELKLHGAVADFFFRHFDGRGFQRTARLRGIFVVLVWNDLKEQF